MTKETIILIFVWAFTAFLLWKFIPREKYIEAQISFLFMQVLTWFFGAMVVERNLIEYPVDFFDNAYQASFTFEYFVFPSVSALFNTNYPQHKSKVIKLLFSFSFPVLITIAEVILENTTHLIEYINWHWSISLFSMWIFLYFSLWYTRWFLSKIIIKK